MSLLTGFAGDADNKAATVGDLRRMLQEQTEHQNAEISTMLKEFALELKCGTSRKAFSGTFSGGAEPGTCSEPVDQRVRKDRPGEFDGAHGGLQIALSEKTRPAAASPSQGEGNGAGCEPGLSPGGDSGRADSKSAGGGTSDGQMPRASLKGAGFNIAKALGFEAIADSMQRPEKPSESLLAADQSSGKSDKLAHKSKSFISKKAAMSAKGHLPLVQRFVRSAAFENLTGAIVCINAIVIGAHANLRALHPGKCQDNWNGIFWIFHGLFTIELATRIAIYRREFLFGSDYRWNLFDSVIVVAGLLEEVMEAILGGEADCMSQASESNSSVVSGITVLRILRMLRVVRIIKAFRTMTIFRDLRIMIASTLGCLVPLAWACLLLFFIQWCFSVYFLYLSTEYVTQAIADFGIEVLDDDTKPYKKLRTFFGSLWLSIYTLFQTITGGGDWGPPADALYQATGQIHPIIFYMCFIALTVFAVLNVITGVFVENATKIAMQDRELIIQDAISHRNHYKEDVLAVFREADADGSGELTIEEFEVHLKDPRVQAFLESLELDGMGATRMFRLLDFDGDGWVSATEFVTGCMCFKGDAKTMDVAALLLEVNKMSSSLSKSIHRLEGRLTAATATIV